LDALLIIAPPDAADDIIGVLRSKDIAADVIGKVVEGSGAKIEIGGEIMDFSPRFRESAYTPIKKLVGEDEPIDFEQMCDSIDNAAQEAIDKKRMIVERLKQ
jgi:hydrogenase expression/formation protein